MKDEDYMARAIALSQSAAARGDEPFGAVLVKDGEIVCEFENAIHTRHDPTLHAELGLLRQFFKENDKKDLKDYTLYSSCEPCFMCSGALAWAKIGRLVYGATHSELEHLFGRGDCGCCEYVFAHSLWKPQVTAGLLSEDAIRVLAAYFPHGKGV